MATVNSRVQFNITARNQTAAPFAATKRGLDSLSGAARNLKFALGAALGANFLAQAIRGLIRINATTEPLKTAFDQMHRAFQAFAFGVGNSGLNAALVSFSQTVGAMVGRTDSLAKAIGATLGAAVKGVEILFVSLGRVVGFVGDNFQFFQNILLSLALQRVAIMVVGAARAFVAFATTVRAAGIATAFFVTIQRLGIKGFLLFAAGAAYATGNIDKLKGAVEFLSQKAEEMLPKLQRWAVEGLANMGFETDSLTVDLDALKGSLSSLPPVIETSTAAAQKFRTTGKMLKTDIVSAADEIKNSFSDMGSRIADSLFGIAQRTTTVTEAVRNMANDILQQLLRIALDRVWQQLMTVGIGSFFGGVAPGVGPGGMGFSHFGGPRAAGGSVRKGMFYTVGEDGPETLVAGGDGHILPNRAGSSGGGTQVNVYNNSGAPVQTRKRQQGGVQITDVIIGEVKKAMGDGRFDGIMGQKFGMRPQLTSR